MTPPKIITTRGELTAYGLACGYVERFDTGEPVGEPLEGRVSLWMEHGAYHVRAFLHGERLAWDTWRSSEPGALRLARARYRELRRTVRAGGAR